MPTRWYSPFTKPNITNAGLSSGTSGSVSERDGLNQCSPWNGVRSRMLISSMGANPAARTATVSESALTARRAAASTVSVAEP
jgi:hypothetical protein